MEIDYLFGIQPVLRIQGAKMLTSGPCLYQCPTAILKWQEGEHSFGEAHRLARQEHTHTCRSAHPTMEWLVCVRGEDSSLLL